MVFLGLCYFLARSTKTPITNLSIARNPLSSGVIGVVEYGATWHTFKPKLFGKSNYLNPRLKEFLYFLKKSLSYVSGNKTSSGGNFSSTRKKGPTLKKFLIFWEMELSSPKQKALIFQEGTCKS